MSALAFSCGTDAEHVGRHEMYFGHHPRMATRVNVRPAPPPSDPSVPPESGIALLRRLIEKATWLRDGPNVERGEDQAWINLARDYLSRAFGKHSPNVESVIHISGTGGLRSGMSQQEIADYYRSQYANRIPLLEGCTEQLQTDIDLGPMASSAEDATSGAASAAPAGSKVFVVHGHDHGTKEAVARFLERLGLEPVILHERPNAGRTIIEKFSDYANVNFAVVLLTADDEGGAKADTSSRLAPRARQNVILELGYFLGRLGRAKVCALYESGVEIPSDYQGVLFVELDGAERWRFELVRELVAAGFEVDANRIFAQG